MKLPKEIKEYIKKNKGFTSLSAIKMLSTIRNKKCIRWFGYKESKTYGKECKEIFREYLDHNEVSNSLYFTCCGYQIAWGRKNQRTVSWVQFQTPDDTFKKLETWKPNVSSIYLFTESDIEEHFKNEIPYLKVKDIGCLENTMEYLRTYIKHPELELLDKFGFGYLCKYKMLFKLTKVNQKKVVQWLVENKQYVEKYKPCYQFIMMGVKNGENAEQTVNRCYVMNDVKYLKQFNYTYDDLVKIRKYINEQNFSIYDYKDYIKASEELGREIHEYGVMFPRNFGLAHDEIMKIRDQKVNEKLNRKLATVYKKLKEYELLKYKGLQIRIPNKNKQFVDLGKKLHNCVGTMGYSEKMSKGKCIILAVYKNNVPVECCELMPVNEKSKRMKIIQLRGDHNGKSEFHDLAEKLVNKFIGKYKSKRAGLCF